MECSFNKKNKFKKGPLCPFGEHSKMRFHNETFLYFFNSLNIEMRKLSRVPKVKPWQPQINHGFASNHSLTMVFVVNLWLNK